MVQQATHQTAPVKSRTSARESAKAQLVVVANRLPVQHSTTNGGDEWRPSPGGLVSALTAVLQNRNGLWIGWPGTTEYENVPANYEGIRLKAVNITPDEFENFYLGFRS